MTPTAPSPWAAIDYAQPVAAPFVVPPEHWPHLAALPLPPAALQTVTRAAAAFSCEMFVQCERYVIHYLERFRARLGGVVSDGALDRFVLEERLHIDAFLRLLRRHGAIPAAGPLGTALLRWRWLDAAVLTVTPAVSLFVIAALFEEMSLHVATVMEQSREPGDAPYLTVMQQHTRDEKGHLAIDDRALDELLRRRGPARFALAMWFALPLMAYVDWRLGRAWRRLMQRTADELGLPPEQRRALLRRRPSASDVLGVRGFLAKLERHRWPGRGLVAWALAGLLR